MVVGLDPRESGELIAGKARHVQVGDRVLRIRIKQKLGSRLQI